MSFLIKYEDKKFHILTGYQKTIAGMSATWEEIKIDGALDLSEDDIDAEDLAQVLNLGSYAVLEVD